MDTLPCRSPSSSRHRPSPGLAAPPGLGRTASIGPLLLLLLPLAAPARAERRGGTLVLTRSSPTASGENTLVAPGREKQDYTFYEIDCRDFPAGGKLVFDIRLGTGKTDASFDLFPGGTPLPTTGGPAGTLGGAYDVAAGGPAGITHRFEGPSTFRFGATGNWFSEPGVTNTFSFTVRVEEFPGAPQAAPASPSPPTSQGPSGLTGALSGGGTLVLTHAKLQASGNGTLTAPGYQRQAFTVFRIDTRDFPRGGFLTFFIQLGNGESDASFDIFPEGAPIPTEGGPAGSLAGVYDVRAGSEAKLDLQFSRGQVFKFGATGNWSSRKGATNTFSFTAKVTP